MSDEKKGTYSISGSDPIPYDENLPTRRFAAFSDAELREIHNGLYAADDESLYSNYKTMQKLTAEVEAEAKHRGVDIWAA